MPEENKRRGLGCGFYGLLVLLLIQVALYIPAHARLGIPSIITWYLGSDRAIWPTLCLILLIIGVVIALNRRPVWNRRRAASLACLALLVLSPFFYRSFPSTHDDSPSAIAFRVPLDGPVTVGWGGATADVNYHVLAPDQRWAYDLVVARDGTTHKGDGKSLEDYYCYGMPVLAPAPGKVISTYVDAKDMPPGQLGGSPPAGNYLILEVAPEEFLMICHLKPGSLVLKEGDHVQQGDTIGQVGNSGNTSEPHLHIHLQDSSIPHIGQGIPMKFHGYTSDGILVESGIPTGGLDGRTMKGEVIEHAADEEVTPRTTEGGEAPVPASP